MADVLLDRIGAVRRVHDHRGLEALARLSEGRVRVRVRERLPSGAPASIAVAFDLVSAVRGATCPPPTVARARPVLVLDLSGTYPVEPPRFELHCELPLFVPAVAGVREAAAAVAAARGQPAPRIQEPAWMPKAICLLRKNGWRPLDMDLEFLARQAWRVLTLCPAHLNAMNDRMNPDAADYWAHHQGEWTLPLTPPLPEPPPTARQRASDGPGAFVLEDA
jgi:hypothetical protein